MNEIKNMNRKLIFALGMLLIIPLFTPYFSISELLSIPLDKKFSLAPIDIVNMSDKISALTAYISSDELKELFNGVVVIKLLMFIPVFLGIVSAVITIIWKNIISHIIAIIMESGGLVCCVSSIIKIMTITRESEGMIKISPGVGLILGTLLLVAMIVLSCISYEKEKIDMCEDNGSGAVVKKGEGSITGMDGTYEGATLPVTGEPVIIGRDTSVCNMIVVGDMVSREHCTVSYNRESHIYMVTDLSSNGTYDGNGKRLANGVPVYMEAGSMIRIGKDGERFILG